MTESSIEEVNMTELLARASASVVLTLNQAVAISKLYNHDHIIVQLPQVQELIQLIETQQKFLEQIVGADEEIFDVIEKILDIPPRK